MAYWTVEKLEKLPPSEGTDAALSLIYRAETTEAMLLSVEWVTIMDILPRICAHCRNLEHVGHASNCRLAAHIYMLSVGGA